MILTRFSHSVLLRGFILSCIAAIFCGFAGYAAASVPSPRIKPAPQNSSEILNSQDAKTFRLAMRAADRRTWGEVKRLESKLSDPTARSLLLWRRATSDARVSFADLTRVAHDLPDWPRMNRVRGKAEKLMFDKPLSANETIAWFRGNDPISGEGRAALARAHYSLGNQSSGDKWLKLAWRESKLTRDRQRTLFGKYKGRLSQDDHAARADHLIWLGTRYYSSAEALLPHMSRSDRNLMNARIRVGANRSGMQAALNTLTKSQAKDTGVLFERARWRRKRKSKDYALPTYLEINAPASTEGGRKRLWTEKKLMAYWLMETKKYGQAYAMVQDHGFTRGAQFAEAEFIAGWIALTFLNDPQKAAPHFSALRGGVSLPVSSARASYWQGRAAEAMGDLSYTAYYGAAAQHVNTYYGQLARARINPGNPYLTLPAEADAAPFKTDFESRQIVRALRLIGEVQNTRLYRQFSFHLDDIVTDSRELTLLAGISREYQLMSPAVRAAKQGGRFETTLTDSSYPMPPIITNLGSEFDIPFVLAIARQESEFETNAVSHANAYGMMQMINATAKATARKHRLKYQRSWLTTDQGYAAKLGAHHLHDLLNNYDGSYIMAAAAYNAGPTRVTRWIRRYGDPRTGEVDPIDWVESVPFSETRNYIQRVMENKQVYDARLAGGQAELEILDDLRDGAFR